MDLHGPLSALFERGFGGFECVRVWQVPRSRAKEEDQGAMTMNRVILVFCVSHMRMNFIIIISRAAVVLLCCCVVVLLPAHVPAASSLASVRVQPACHFSISDGS